MILLSIGMLFPFYLIRQFSPAYRTGFDWLFHTDISHIAARFILYGVLAWLVSSVSSNKKRLIFPVIVILYLLGIALLQEIMQILTGQGPAGLDDGFDILVDMSGAVIGLFFFRWQKQKFTTDNTEPPHTQ